MKLLAFVFHSLVYRLAELGENNGEKAPCADLNCAGSRERVLTMADIGAENNNGGESCGGD